MPPRSRNHRVIIAEDDAEMRALLAASLRDSGVSVDLARDGFELRERLFRLRSDALPDAVITDLRMPGWTGMSAIRWLGLHFPEVPVVLVTAFADERTLSSARELGAAMVVPKPLDTAEFQRRVIGLIEARDDIRDACGELTRR